MKFVRIACVLLAAVPFSFGASREIVELQRDVANLQDQVRSIQKTLDQLQALVQQSIQQSADASRQTSASLAVMQNNINDAIKRQQETVSGPVAGVGTKLDQMSEDFRNMRETVLDLNTRVGKLDAKITDLQNTVNVVRSPAAPPPGGTTGITPGGTPPGTMPGSSPLSSTTSPSGPPPGMQADTTYSNAMRDYLAGNYDIALQEFSDYVKYFNSTQFAPNSQYYIGDIYYKKKDFDNALQAFDAVLEHYSENNKTAAAHYMKGKTLLGMGKRDAAAKEFREVIQKYPSSDVAPKSQAELRDLGLPVRTGAASRSRSSRRR